MGDDTANQFRKNGFVVIESLYSKDVINAAKSKALENFRECQEKIKKSQSSFGIGTKQGFKEIVERHELRYEMPYKMDGAEFDFVLLENSLVSTLNEIFENKDYKVINRSCIISLPGALQQSWHCDGPHLSLSEILPCHCLNIFVPLVDITSENGPTEFRPESQNFSNNLAKSMLIAKAKGLLQPLQAPLLPQGSVLLVCLKVSINYENITIFIFATSSSV